MFSGKVDVLIISEENFIHLFLGRSSTWNHSQKHTDFIEVTKGAVSWYTSGKRFHENLFNQYVASLTKSTS